MAYHTIIKHLTEDAVTISFDRPHSRKSILLGADNDISTQTSTATLKPIYKRWSKMLQHVTDNTQTNYICTEWLTFSNFVKWHKKHQTDSTRFMCTPRIDGIKVFSPEYTTLVG